MYIPHTIREVVTTNPTGEVNIGPIPLPVLIVLAIFVPCFVAFFVWLIYLKTVKRCKDKKALSAEEAGVEQPVSADVEIQVQSFMARAHGR
ncbi:hypothetical protein T440DRAFT_400779 [Plenodomus tracheiphilus IPT5]|uniref:Uncharacterized protein n=1 Tax=Plenodomus tracheiphilus IPT5 TaxID=1408161 RepID=A0A6A7B0U6_9PLEO|nr:hypothetical protein T440DRAFT_400779 [Plenodomus tracheiphilus IPT5]